MIGAIVVMPAFANDAIIVNKDRAYHRVGGGVAFGALGQFKRAFYTIFRFQWLKSNKF